ncbi:DUF4097 family beta strand repeat-containing protein [Streptomyces uncialis]|uniref:DUF4097 family beta strand repeat-containing protein n=1 Tax=Streptomyces uncialis TaxID=1048205 RepID=UPI003668EF5A
MTVRTSRPRRSRASLLAVVAAGTMAFGLVATGCTSDPEDDTSPEHRSFALAGRTLTVDSDDSELELVPADIDKVEVTRWFKGKVAVGSEPSVSWSMRDDRLKLRLDCSGIVADCALKHRIEIPRDVTVKVKNDDGSVRASGFRTPLSIDTNDGSVRVADTTGPLTLRSGDGSIHTDGLRSRQVEADTNDGSVRLRLAVVPDRVTADSNDGSVEVTLPRAGDSDGGDGGTAYAVSAKSDDGSVKVSVPRDERSAHVVSARSNDGSVTVRNAD